ncbi:MAG: hypothetical protein RLZZ622_1365 [Planctomycetota bacterium]|jgi:hypothetical protein
MEDSICPLDSEDARERAIALISRFRHPQEVGCLREVAASLVPTAFRELLDHRSHMTVAMERSHGSPVTLEVVAVADHGAAIQAPTPFSYAREILLRCPTVNEFLFPSGPLQPPEVGTVVQYGVVGIALERLPPPIAAEVCRGQRPLGRILIEAGLHREVRDVRLLELKPGPHLTSLFAGTTKQPLPTTYGRVATIDVMGQPVLRLLEVVGVPPLSGKP